MNKFLHETELVDRYTEDEDETPVITEDPEYIGFHNATFAWSVLCSSCIGSLNIDH